MAERKTLSKKIRFEVFKRDKFTCQYCGRMAPDVVLEVDHIKPFSKGGTNDILNLVTSCKDCNRGKSNIKLSDDSTVKKQQMQLQEIAKRKEQLEMMLEWRDSLSQLEDEYVDAIDNIFSDLTDWGVSDHGRRKIKKWLKEFSFKEVMDATETSINAYYDGTEESWNVAFNKVSGICYLRRIQSNDNRMYYANYVIKALKNKGFYYNEKQIRRYFRNCEFDDEDFEYIKVALKEAGCWSHFKDALENHFGTEF